MNFPDHYLYKSILIKSEVNPIYWLRKKLKRFRLLNEFDFVGISSKEGEKEYLIKFYMKSELKDNCPDNVKNSLNRLFNLFKKSFPTQEELS